MIDALLHGEEDVSNYGTFRFETLPVPGDRIVVGTIRVDGGSKL